jgi:3-deoxy-D-manno-octulosonic-acid transferase
MLALQTCRKGRKPLMRFLYSALFYCLVPLLLLRMVLRSRRAPAYRRRLAERFALFDAQALSDRKPVIWVHAVSVGETIAAAPVIESLLQLYPEYRVVVTTTTPTGSERVGALFGDRVFHVYAPWDLPGATLRFLRTLKPQLLLLMETELWPNMIHYTALCGCQIVLANARMSARSARGYARVGALTRPMLAKLSAVACQSRDDADRLLALGLPADRLQVTGSIKFDLALDDSLRAQAAQLRAAFGERPVIVVASTHPGEDEQALTALTAVRGQHDNALLVLVPRHPERFDAVCTLCEGAGFKVTRRSAGTDPGPDTDIYLGDTMGELLLLLGTADVAVVGGSLVEHGGHNVLEPAAWGVPVVTGPHMFNFAEISAKLVAAGAMVQLTRPTGLADCLADLLAQPAERERMGQAGLQVLAANRGAREELLAIVAELLPPG